MGVLCLFIGGVLVWVASHGTAANSPWSLFQQIISGFNGTPPNVTRPADPWDEVGAAVASAVAAGGAAAAGASGASGSSLSHRSGGGGSGSSSSGGGSNTDANTNSIWNVHKGQVPSNDTLNQIKQGSGAGIGAGGAIIGLGGDIFANEPDPFSQ